LKSKKVFQIRTEELEQRTIKPQSTNVEAILQGYRSATKN
jgi:hypothetical protein